MWEWEGIRSVAVAIVRMAAVIDVISVGFGIVDVIITTAVVVIVCADVGVASGCELCSVNDVVIVVDVHAVSIGLKIKIGVVVYLVQENVHCYY